MLHQNLDLKSLKFANLLQHFCKALFLSQDSLKWLRKNPVIIKEKDGLTSASTGISLYKVAEKSVHFLGPLYQIKQADSRVNIGMKILSPQ